jgi:hypothetical protein
LVFSNSSIDCSWRLLPSCIIIIVIIIMINDGTWCFLSNQGGIAQHSCRAHHQHHHLSSSVIIIIIIVITCTNSEEVFLTSPPLADRFISKVPSRKGTLPGLIWAATWVARGNFTLLVGTMDRDIAFTLLDFSWKCRWMDVSLWSRYWSQLLYPAIVAVSFITVRTIQ